MSGTGRVSGATAAPVSHRPVPGFPRGLAVLLGFGGAVVMIAGLRSIASLLGPILLGLILVVAVHPLQRRIASRLPGWVAVTVALLIVYVGLFGLVAALGLSLAQLAVTLPRYTDEFGSLVNQVVALLDRLGVTQAQMSAAAGTIGPDRLLGLVQTLIGQVQGLFSGALLLVTVLVFLVADANRAAGRLALLNVAHARLADALSGFARGIRRYLVVSTVFGVVVAALDTVGLMVLGVPLALMWGLLSFLTNYIPNIGFVLGVVPPTLLGLLAGGPETGILVLVLYSALNVVIESFIMPRYLGNSIGVTTSISFLSLVFWAFVLGPLGALLAIPMTLLVKSLLVDADPDARWVDALIANAPGLPAPRPGPDSTGAGSGPDREPSPPQLAPVVGQPDDGPRETRPAATHS